MCLQCIAEAISYGEIVPGFYLMKSTKDNSEWESGVYGLVECNSPTYYLNGIDEPVCDIFFEKTYEEENQIATDPAFDEQFEIFIIQMNKMIDSLQGDPQSGWTLYESCLKAGYNPEKHHRLERWLLHKIACRIKEVIPKHHSED